MRSARGFPRTVRTAPSVGATRSVYPRQSDSGETPSTAVLGARQATVFPWLSRPISLLTNGRSPAAAARWDGRPQEAEPRRGREPDVVLCWNCDGRPPGGGPAQGRDGPRLVCLNRTRGHRAFGQLDVLLTREPSALTTRLSTPRCHCELRDWPSAGDCSRLGVWIIEPVEGYQASRRLKLPHLGARHLRC